MSFIATVSIPEVNIATQRVFTTSDEAYAFIADTVNASPIDSWLKSYTIKRLKHNKEHSPSGGFGTCGANERVRTFCCLK